MIEANRQAARTRANEFRSRLKASIARNQGILKRLANGQARSASLGRADGSAGMVPNIAEGSRRLAAYAVCIADGRVLVALHVSPTGEKTWTLPGGRVEHGEDPFDTVTREVAEETGCEAEVERLLGVDSRVIPANESRFGAEHQNIGIYYQVRIVGGELRPEPDGEIAESVWTPIAEVARLRRSSLVDVGLALAQTTPATGHVAPVPTGGLIKH